MIRKMQGNTEKKKNGHLKYNFEQIKAFDHKTFDFL